MLFWIISERPPHLPPLVMFSIKECMGGWTPSPPYDVIHVQPQSALSGNRRADELQIFTKIVIKNSENSDQNL